MATLTASAKLTNAFRVRVVDKNISAAITSTATVTAVVRRVLRTSSDLESTASLANTMRYATKGGRGEFVCTSSVVCEFPTYIEIDIEALMFQGLPEGTDCVLNFQEGWMLEDRGRQLSVGGYEYGSNTQDAPSPEFPNFITFRTPKFFRSNLNSVFSIARTVLRIKQLGSTVSGVSTLTARGIFNPGKFAALFGGAFITTPNAVKTARTGATLFNIFGPFGPIALSLRIKQLASVFVTDVATLVVDAIKYKTPGIVTILSSSAVSANVIRNVGASSSAMTSIASFTATSLRTLGITKNLLSTATLTATALRRPGLIQNLSATSSMTVSASIAMILEVNSNSISLPIMFGSVNCSIDWGDGTSTTLTSTNGIQPQHAYSAPYGAGVTKQIKISGYIQHFGYASTANVPDWNSTNSSTGSLYWAYNSLTKIVSFGDLGTETFISAFSNARSCSGGIPTRLPSTITDISGMFQHTVADDQFQNFSNVSGWNVSNVTKMEKTFYRCRGGFNPNIGTWNVANVTNMDRMFYFADSAAFNPDLSQWCVTLIPTEPNQFSSLDTTRWPANRRPQWGTCP
jgi:hypothetical protein